MIYRFLLLVMLITVGFPRPLKAEVTTDGAILIITSYNPETRSISDNLSAFMDEYKLRGGKRLITIESMNCKNLSEAHLWKERMASILEKYERTAAPFADYIIGSGGVGIFHLSEFGDSQENSCHVRNGECEYRCPARRQCGFGEMVAR